MASEAPEKTCENCGRRMTWRKAWANNWDSVRYCSDKCRRSKPTSQTSTQVEHSILTLLAGRSAGATICPSDAAKRHYGDDWREHMEDVRNAARRLVARGEVEITQKGSPVDPSTAKGPIRIRRI